MSTAHEVIAAKHCGLHVFGLSLITNLCVMEFDVETPTANHLEVLQVGQDREEELKKLLRGLIEKIDKIFL
ncbi:hypothetical protein JTE90_001334 [Oedothorax gibbosus]|uniref:purine-nucleoside phosphorylase n=1 Tax=Oedothorax gibbosus TaxID=931172 RepID=A0AAV6V366_9ARAC|nr:hypothetical protein JTE90_001334 [Oedothorax gibbosus]